MRKSTKKILALATAATLSLGIVSIAACGSDFKTPAGIPEGAAESNGGFVVGVGDYYYFINGVETSDADNAYGAPVKGALQRIRKADVEAGVNSAETVIPSLMVAGDHEAGIFVYGGRVYFATPTNVRNTSGVVENSWLDFKSAKLDGTDIRHHFRLETNTTPYRFVEENGVVYVLYVEGSSAFDIHSFNTETGEDVLLVREASEYQFHASEKGEPYLYYTMGVRVRPDSDYGADLSYNQIYRVRADATEAPYDYEWDQAWLDENNDGEEPYHNFGELVLDGVGANDFRDNYSQFNHSETVPGDPVGYIYSLKTYDNGGLYFTRKPVSAPPGVVGASGTLYFLEETDLASGWDTIAANDSEAESFDVIASDAASSSVTDAFFYREGGKHHYIYADGSNLIRVDVEDGAETTIVRTASSPKIIGIDNESDAEGYHYLYYANSVSGGSSINRAVYNGVTDKLGTGKDDYSNLTHPEDHNDYYVPVRILEAVHTSGWYDVEIVDNVLFFADGKTYGGNSFNYVSTINLKDENGLMDNVELAARNDLYDEIVDIVSDRDEALLSRIRSDVNDILAEAIECYFYTGNADLVNENVREYEDAIKEDADLENPYEEKDREAFAAYVEGKGYTYDEVKLFEETDFKEGDASFRTQSFFVTKIGTWDDADNEAWDDYWRSTFLTRYTPPEEEETHLPAWAIALIVIGSVLVVGLAGLLVLHFFHKKRQNAQKAPKEKRMHVDTTDDRDIDVYAVDPEPTPEEELTEEPAPEEPAPEEPVPEEPVPEEPAPEEPAPEEPVPEEPAPEEPAPEEPAPETPDTPNE